MDLKVVASLEDKNFTSGLAKMRTGLDNTGTAAVKAAGNFDAISPAVNKAAKSFDEIAAGNSALNTINANIDKAVENAIELGNAVENIGSGSLAKIEGPLKSLQTQLAETAVSAGKIDSSLDFISSRKNLGDFKAQLTRFKQALEQATNPASILRLNRAIEATQQRIKAVAQAKSTDGLSGFAKGANEAAFATQNLSRVVQDLPFGFIGIANNLNPLLESFQRLRKESGSTGGALKALVSSLGGAGGLGLALGIISSAFIFASIGLQAWKGRNTEAKAAVDENKKATEAYAKSLKEVAEQGKVTGIQLQNFVNIARDQSQSLATRNHALEEANKILGDHGEKLNLVNIATQAVTDQINKFTQATIQQALATKFADRAADLFINQKEAAKAYGVELAKLQELSKKTLSFENAQGVRVLTDAGKEVQKQQAIVVQLANDYKRVTGEVKGVVSELSAAQLAASQLFGSLSSPDKITGIIAKIRAEIKRLTDIQPTLLDEKSITQNVAQIKTLNDELDRLLGKSHGDKAKKDLRSINDVLREMNAKVRELNQEEVLLNVDNSTSRVQAFLNAIRELVIKFKLDPNGALVQDLFNDAKLAKVGFIVEKGFAKLGIAARKAFEDAMKNVEAPIEAFQAPEIPKITDFSEFDKAAKIAFLKGQGVKKAFASGIASKVPIEILNKAEVDNLLDDTIENIARFNNGVNDFINTNVVNTFSALGDAFTQALGGQRAEDIFGGFFKAILESLGTGMQKLGVAMLTANKAIQVAKALFGKAAGIGASVGLIAIGSLIKALAARIKVPQLAVGTRSAPGGLTLVGERGPEYVMLPRGAGVIPNAQTNNMVGEQQVFIAENRIEGSSLVTIFKRASASNSRNGF